MDPQSFAPEQSIAQPPSFSDSIPLGDRFSTSGTYFQETDTVRNHLNFDTTRRTLPLLAFNRTGTRRNDSNRVREPPMAE